MPLLSSFFRLDGANRRLVLESLFVVTAVRVALTVVPFRLVHGAVFTAIERGRRSPSTRVSPERVAWAVSAVARRIGHSNCLTSVLGASLLLVHYGHQATVRLGVAKSASHLDAHAWLESDGRAILGAPAPGTLAAFPPLPVPQASGSRDHLLS